MALTKLEVATFIIAACFVIFILFGANLIS